MPTIKLPIPPSTPATIPTRAPAERAESCAVGLEVEVALGATDELEVGEIMIVIDVADTDDVDFFAVEVIGIVLVFSVVLCVVPCIGVDRDVVDMVDVIVGIVGFEVVRSIVTVLGAIDVIVENWSETVGDTGNGVFEAEGGT